MSLSRRLLLAATLATGFVTAASAQPKEVRIDFATYNPVSLVLKERAFSKKNSPRMASPFVGCSPWAPTRRSNS